MDVQIRHAPSFAAARLGLAPGEAVKCESGAMMAHSASVSPEAKAEGGVFKSLKRSVLGGESLFITTYTADGSGGWVDVAANLPGDLRVYELAGNDVGITRGSWLASGTGVQLETKWGGFKNLFGGEGGFLVHAEGTGPVVVSCYGATDDVQLAPGEQLVVDSGHVVAFDPSIGMELTKAAKGWIGSATSGEGLVFRFTGPGWVTTQSRNPTALIDWLTQVLPFSRT